MTDLSPQSIKENCPHCNTKSFAIEHPLKETKNFLVVCDVHPICGGHILIIPKEHLSCIGEYTPQAFNEFQELFNTFSEFLSKQYGSVSSFEHGKIAQTVFHSHVHLVPFSGKPFEIIPEGEEYYSKISKLEDLFDIYKKEDHYLYFSIGKIFWNVDCSISASRFFRDRFANVFGNPERGNWKEMRANPKIMAEAKKDISNLKKKWNNYR